MCAGVGVSRCGSKGGCVRVWVSVGVGVGEYVDVCGCISGGGDRKLMLIPTA